jgi:carbonic anhydrase
MGEITFKDTTFNFVKAYVKSPSEHKIEGQSFDAEIQISATAGSNRLVLVKLLQKMPSLNSDFEIGLKKFEFGTNKLRTLADKISLDQELDLIISDKMDYIPVSSLEISKIKTGVTF